MVCRARREDTEMLRAGRDADEQWYLGRGTGRGAWCCKGSACVEALRVTQVARSLRTPFSQCDLEALLGLYGAGGGLARQ